MLTRRVSRVQLELESEGQTRRIRELERANEQLEDELAAAEDKYKAIKAELDSTLAELNDM